MSACIDAEQKPSPVALQPHGKRVAPSVAEVQQWANRDANICRTTKPLMLWELELVERCQMAAAKPKADPKKQLRLDDVDDKSRDRRLAEIGLDPAAHAAANVVLFNKGSFGTNGLTETYEALHHEAKQVGKGNLAVPEAMLVGQAQSLNAIFTELARRSALNMGEYIEASERYMRLALKAQAQCRATIETLAALKNPPVVIARQANISNGPQQVNNGASRAGDLDNQPNELLEHRDEQRLEPRAAAATGASDPALVAVEASHRA